MSRHGRIGAISAEASKAGNYEAGICGKQIVWVEFNRLEDSGAKGIDKDVGIIEERFEKGTAIGRFEIQGYGGLVAT